MQRNADIYRSRADECELAALRATTIQSRDRFLELARGWRAMAEHIDRTLPLAISSETAANQPL